MCENFIHTCAFMREGMCIVSVVQVWVVCIVFTYPFFTVSRARCTGKQRVRWRRQYNYSLLIRVDKQIWLAGLVTMSFWWLCEVPLEWLVFPDSRVGDPMEMMVPFRGFSVCYAFLVPFLVRLLSEAFFWMGIFCSRIQFCYTCVYSIS